MIVRRQPVLLPMLVPALALALVASACGGGGEPTVNLPDAGQDDGGITIEGPTGGEVSIGTGNYPDGWPSDFPVPEGATPAYWVGSAAGVAVWFSTDQSLEEVKAFFTSALPAAGYTIDSTVDLNDPNGNYTVIAASGNGWTGGIYIGENLGSVAAGYEGDFDFWVTLAPA